jgi:hypothetical protein
MRFSAELSPCKSELDVNSASKIRTRRKSAWLNSELPVVASQLYNDVASNATQAGRLFRQTLDNFSLCDSGGSFN